MKNRKKLTILLGQDGFKLHNPVAENKKKGGWVEFCESHDISLTFHLFVVDPGKAWPDFQTRCKVLHSTAKHAGHLRIAGCIQRLKLSGHPSHNFKWPHFRFLQLVLVDTFKKGHYKLLLGGHSQDILISFWGISHDFMRTFWGLFGDFMRTFWLLS